MKPTECSCEKCKAMCAHSTCMCTPAQARSLIKDGYADRLAVYQFDQHSTYVGPAPQGYVHGKVLGHTRNGPCAFFNGTDCELHSRDKPLEGTLAHHDLDWRIPRLHVISTWKGKQGQSIAATLARKQTSK